MSTHQFQLQLLGACHEGQEWAATQPDAATAWASCERADWMLWLLGRLAGPPHSPSRLALVACCADCAETSVHLIRDKGIRDQVKYGLALLRRYLRGDSTLEEARRVLSAAYAAAAAYTATATAAAYTAAYTATATAAAYTATYTATATAAAYTATFAATATAAAYAADRSRALRDMADIVRRHFPSPPAL